MKRIWVASTVLLLTAAVKAKAQTDTTFRKSDNAISRSDTTVTTSLDTAVATSGTTVTKSTSVNTVSNTSYTTKNTERTGVRVGVRAGINSSNMKKSGNKDIDFSTGAKTGFNAALFLEIPIIPEISIQPELQFSQKGYKAKGTYASAPYEYKQTSNFIEVPLLAKFKPTQNFGLIIGPQFSFLTSTKTKVTVANTSHENLVDTDNSNLRKNILGGVIGLEASSGPVIFDLRYSLDFQKNNGDGTSTTPSYKNQVIALSVGFRF
ncbi:hypothetical protein BH11BAC5_BH11BAC5_08070 [soil metagenome]